MNLLTTEQAAQELGVSTRTIKAYAAQGKLKGKKIGGKWRFTQTALEQYASDWPGYVARMIELAPRMSEEFKRIQATEQYDSLQPLLFNLHIMIETMRSLAEAAQDI